MPRSNASPITYNTVVLEKGTTALTRLNVSDPNMTIIFHVEPSANVSLVVMLAQGSPNRTHSSSTAILNQTGTVSTDGATVWAQHPHRSWFTPCVLLGWLIFVIATGGYRWMITPEMLQQTPGVWYIDTRLFNSEWKPGLTLNMYSFMTKCLYWHTERGVWSTDGCQARSDLCGCSYFMTFCCHQSVSVVSGGREKHSGACAVSVQPPHPVWKLLLCDAQRRRHIPHSRAVCHRVAELRGAGIAVCLLRPVPDHSAVGLLRWPQVTLKGQSEDYIITCGYAQTVTRNSST